MYKSNFRLVLCTHKCRFTLSIGCQFYELNEETTGKIIFNFDDEFMRSHKKQYRQHSKHNGVSKIAYDDEGSLSFNYRHGGVSIFERMLANTFPLPFGEEYINAALLPTYEYTNVYHFMRMKKNV